MPGDLFYRLQKSTNPHIGPSSRDFSGDAQTARDICLQKSTKIYMRTCARGFRRGRPSAHYKAARNGPAPEKERHFRAFSLPRFWPFSSRVFRSAGPRSDRCLDRASDSGPFLPAYRRIRAPSGQRPIPLPGGPTSTALIQGCPIRQAARPRFRADARSDRIPRSADAVRSSPLDPSGFPHAATATALSADSWMPDPDLIYLRFDARLRDCDSPGGNPT